MCEGMRCVWIQLPDKSKRSSRDALSDQDAGRSSVAGSQITVLGTLFRRNRAVGHGVAAFVIVLCPERRGTLTQEEWLDHGLIVYSAHGQVHVLPRGRSCVVMVM